MLQNDLENAYTALAHLLLNVLKLAMSFNQNLICPVISMIKMLITISDIQLHYNYFMEIPNRQ